MGKVFGGGSSPTPPAPPPEATPAPKAVDPEVKKARSDERRRAARAVGRSSTILTSPLGLASAQTTDKTLLGV